MRPKAIFKIKSKETIAKKKHKRDAKQIRGYILQRGQSKPRQDRIYEPLSMR